MQFSYGAVWNDTVAMLRANASLLIALAGAFLFLPALLSAYLLPPPTGAADFAEMMAQMQDYTRANWHWSLLVSLVNMVGTLAVYMLLLEPGGRTVGGAIAGAARFVPSYLLLWLLMAVPISIGLLLFVIPGVYLAGRIATSTAVMIGSGSLNPINAVAGSFALTAGRGWAIAGLILIVLVTGFIAMIAVQAVLGSIFLLVGGGIDGIGGLLVAILNAALGAALSTLIITLLAAIYRALAPRSA